VFLFVASHPREVGYLSHIEVMALEDSDAMRVGNRSDADAPLLSTETSKEPKAVGCLHALRIPGVIAYALCYSCLKSVNYTMFFWLPNFLSTELGMSASVSDDMSTLFDVGGIIGGFLAGVLSDRLRKRSPVLTVFLLLGVITLAVFNVGAHDHPSLVALIVINGVLVGG